MEASRTEMINEAMLMKFCYHDLTPQCRHFMKFPMRSAHQYFLSDSQPPVLSALSKNSVVQNDTSLSLSFCTHSTNLVSFGIYHSGSCSDVGGELQRKK